MNIKNIMRIFKRMAPLVKEEDTRIVLVVAGTYTQFRYYCKRHKLPLSQARYVCYTNDFLGYTPKRARVVFTGTWWKLENSGDFRWRIDTLGFRAEDGVVTYEE